MRNLCIVLCVVFLLHSPVLPFDSERILSSAAKNSREVQTFLEGAEERGYREWAEFLLSPMPDVDLVNMSADEFLSHCEGIKRNLGRVPWRNEIDPFLFRYYVLPHRVSQEPLESFTSVYADTLYDLISGVEDMRGAVLRVNEWVFTKMKYEPTSRWDQNGTITIERGFGRCEEMAILCIKALRTVCIPARKVYSPWWPFTNSNHAWVEVWVEGKWFSLGGGEPTDLGNAWFSIPAKRTGIVKGVVYGEMDSDNEIVEKNEEGYTVINTTSNYADLTALTVKVEMNGAPQESSSVSICVYNYSSLPPIGLEKTDGSGCVTFRVGRTDLFVYGSKDTLTGYTMWRPSPDSIDTLIVSLSRKEFPDTSFWIYTKRLDGESKESVYSPNRDSLKLLQNINLERITLVDSTLASAFEGRERKLIMILYHARAKAKSLLAFYKKLSLKERELFVDYCDALPPKDIVSLDTCGLGDELRSVKKSLQSFGENVPDSIVSAYLTSDRILFEQFGKWRMVVQKDFLPFKKKDTEQTVDGLYQWTKGNVRKVEKKGYFGPMKNTADVYHSMSGVDSERYLFMVGVLRSLGIPARVKWSYDALEYWDDGWHERSFSEKGEENHKVWVSLAFLEDGKEMTEKKRYYYDYSITRFGEYPERLDPPVETGGGSAVLTLDDEPVYCVTGWRNGFGDTYVRVQRIHPSRDTTKENVECGIPSEIKPGDLLIREYRGLDLTEFGLSDEERDSGSVLIIVFDTESEASKSTLKNGLLSINNFKGNRLFFADVERQETADEFLSEMGIEGRDLFTISKETYKKKWRMRNLPSILLLKDGECVFWVEGLFLHLSRLLDDLK
jgi:transglutaminase-like putative cysteine protease